MVNTKRPYKLGISDLYAICRASVYCTWVTDRGEGENGVGAMFETFTREWSAYKSNVLVWAVLGLGNVQGLLVLRVEFWRDSLIFREIRSDYVSQPFS